MERDFDQKMTGSTIEKALFVSILAAYLLAGALFAIITPAWQAPDEPAHYNYIRQVAQDGCCPRIEAGDWQGEYQQQLTTVKFAPDYLDRLDTIEYEDHHPPLYYLLASIVFKLSDGDLTKLRLFSAVLGAVTVILSYLICRRVFPLQPQISLAVMALVAFLPQHLAMMSAVNNDALAEIIVAAGLLWIVRYLLGEDVPTWQLGIIAGLALWTKITIYFLALLFPLAILLRWRKSDRPIAALSRDLAIFAAVALLIGGGWWLRNISVYGFPDFLGLGAHDAVVSDQLRTADHIARHGWGTYLAQILSVTFKSFWGQFGWMALPLDSVLGGWIYRGFGLLTLAGISGLMRSLWSGRAMRVPAQGAYNPSRNIFTVLAAALLLVLLAFVYYNIEFVQWQGRYLFPALIPIALALVAGLDSWRGKLCGRCTGSRWLTVGALICLFPLDLYLLFRVIVPGLSP